MTPTEPQKTGQELRAETITAMNAAITASGLPDGWTTLPRDEGFPWDPDTEEFLGADCSTENGSSRQRFVADLYHTPVGDPVEFAHKMAQYWADQGYTVSAVGDTANGLGHQHYTDYRADRADGTLYAGVVGSDALFNLEIFSECSTDPTLDKFAGPTGYRDFDYHDPDPYHPTNHPTITPYPTPEPTG
ncbi:MULTISPECIES: hypothetical protein [unclassified Leifsonia]|uniref:hypothetical protein n=1 Tax=unclassified Leifsonia TaxID=2663824 RepID=UPI0011140478|nr:MULTISPECIES: hypothetical protein [unclassified Leifsonia]